MTALHDSALAKEGVASSGGKSTKSKVSMFRELTVKEQYSDYARYVIAFMTQDTLFRGKISSGYDWAGLWLTLNLRSGTNNARLIFTWIAKSQPSLHFDFTPNKYK